MKRGNVHYVSWNQAAESSEGHHNMNVWYKTIAIYACSDICYQKGTCQHHDQKLPVRTFNVIIYQESVHNTSICAFGNITSHLFLK